MAHRSAQSTRAGGRPKSGEVDLGLPVKFCQVRGLGKLHGPMAELTEALADLVGHFIDAGRLAAMRPFVRHCTMGCDYHVRIAEPDCEAICSMQLRSLGRQKLVWLRIRN